MFEDLPDEWNHKTKAKDHDFVVLDVLQVNEVTSHHSFDDLEVLKFVLSQVHDSLDKDLTL